MLMHIHLLSQNQNSPFSRTLLFYGTVFLLMLLQLPRGNVGINCEDFCEGERTRFAEGNIGVFKFDCGQYGNWIDQVACLNHCDCAREGTSISNCDNGKFTCGSKRSDYTNPDPERFEGGETHHTYHGDDSNFRHDAGTGLVLMIIFVYVLIPICCICLCVFAVIGFARQTQPAYAPPILAIPMPMTGMGYGQPQIIHISSPDRGSASSTASSKSKVYRK